MAGEVEQDIFRAFIETYWWQVFGPTEVRFEAYGFGLWSDFQTRALGLLQTGTTTGPLRLAGHFLFMTCEMASGSSTC